MKLLAKLNGCVACLLLIVFLVAMGSSPVMAKVDCDKNPNHPTCPNPDPPPDPEPDPDPVDPCTNFADPDFAFLRDTGKTTGRYKTPTEVTIYLAESFTGCEMSLLEIPIIAPVSEIRNLKFSSLEDASGFFGRVVWTSNEFSRAFSVWKQDFYIEDAEVVLDGSAVEIMRNSLLEHATDWENIYSLDLSHDTRTLVYEHDVYYPDPNNPDVTHGPRFLRILNIDSCDDPGAEPCEFGSSEHSFVIDNAFGTTSDVVGFSFPSWGPYDQRIYVRKNFDDPETGRIRALRYYDLEENWQVSEWPPEVVSRNTITSNFVLETLPDTEYGHFRQVSSGILGGVEYLAVEDEFSAKTGGCEGIFIVEAEDCLINGNCATNPVFAGAYATWSKDGKLIHAYDGWEPHGGCGLSSVGYWDIDNNLESLFDGYRPDSAGGIR